MHASRTNMGSRPFQPPAPLGRKITPIENPSTWRIWWGTCILLPKIMRNPIEVFAHHHFENPTVTYKIFSKPFVIINDPDYIRHIFVENAAHLDLEPIRQRVLKPVLREGLLTAEGGTWRKTRKAVAPVFAPRHVNQFAQGMDKTTRHFINTVDLSEKKHFIAPMMSRLTMQILSDALFSGDVGDKSEQILANTAHFLEHMSSPDPLDLLDAPHWIPRLTKLRGGKAIQNLRAIVRETAHKRQTTMKKGGKVPDDFLTLLLKCENDDQTKLSMDEIEDNIITFIAAGHETTARALSWTLYLLAHDADARIRAEQEVDALDIKGLAPHEWGKNLPWLTACLEESMRLFPPAPALLRQTRASLHFKDYTPIPAGTNIFISTWVLHRHQTLWEKPLIFDPHRFYGHKRNQIHRFAYLPFGLGPRICIGMQFAMAEAQIILTHLLRHFRFIYEEEKKPWPLMKITIQPDNAMPMTIQKRA